MNQSISSRRLRVSFVTFGVSLVALIVVYVSNTLTEAINERRETPRPRSGFCLFAGGII